MAERDQILNGDSEPRVVVADRDSTLREIANEAIEEARALSTESVIATPKPISIRLAPSIRRQLHPRQPQYVGWRGVSWMVTVRDFEQGVELRETLDLVFKALTAVGLKRLKDALLALVEG